MDKIFRLIQNKIKIYNKTLIISTKIKINFIDDSNCKIKAFAQMKSNLIPNTLTKEHKAMKST